MQSEIAQFLRYLSVERNASELTVKSYREDLIDLAEYLVEQLGSDIDPDGVTPRDLRGYAAALHEAGYARTSISRKLASLRSFYRFAQQRQLAKTNPAKPLRNPREQRRLPHFLTNDEVGQLLDAPPKRDMLGMRDAAILETMYSAGLRVSEVVGLNDGDIDLQEGVARVRGKGRKERLSPVGSFAVAALRR
jgi:integrase/recombinase XerC